MALTQKVINYDEYMVGRNHPSLADTLSRAFLQDHDIYGGHVKISYASLFNKSGDQRSAGDVVVQDPTIDNAYVTSYIPDDTRHAFVVCEVTPANDAGYLVGYGITQINVRGNVTRGNHLAVSALRTAGVSPLTSTSTAVMATSHGLAVGDFVELTSGAQVGQVRRVTVIVDADNFQIATAFGANQSSTTWNKVEAGKAKDVGTARTAGSFAVALTSYAGGGLGVITAIVYGSRGGDIQTALTLTNKSGVNRVLGEVCVVDTTVNQAFTVHTTPSQQRRVVVLVENILKDAAGPVQAAGVATVRVRGNVVRGDGLVVAATRFPAANVLSTTGASANSTAHGLVEGDWVELTSGPQRGQLRYVIAVADANNFTLDSGFSVNQTSQRWSKVEVGRAASAGSTPQVASFGVALTSFTGTTGTVVALLGESTPRSSAVHMITAFRQMPITL